MGSDIESTRWMVHWPARTLTAKRELQEVIVSEVAKGGVTIKYPHSLALGTPLNIEFHVNFRNKRSRIRAKTEVTYCQLTAKGTEALLDLKIRQTTAAEIHLLNNILMALAESNEVDLRVKRDIKVGTFSPH